MFIIFFNGYESLVLGVRISDRSQNLVWFVWFEAAECFGRTLFDGTRTENAYSVNYASARLLLFLADLNRQVEFCYLYGPAQ